MNNKIYILIPNKHRTGGVANFYRTLRDYLSPDYEYVYRGNSRKDESGLSIPWRMCKDYALFHRKVSRGTRAVVINSSLGTGGFFRDGLYFLLAPVQVRKVVFFRGWNPFFQQKIDKLAGLKAWLNRTFLTADHIIVLSSEFREKLRQWGYTGPVSLGSTIVDEQLLEGEDFQSLSRARTENENPTILYLGNISRAKGVREVLQAYELLHGQDSLKHLKCVMAGEGAMLDELKDQAAARHLNIQFPGYVRREQKTAAFKNAHIYVFPSAHEGMPTSVLEAMAFGLPVITTRVGGVPDFFDDGRMGLFLDNQKPAHIAEKIQYLLDRPELMRQMSEYNYHYAREHFYAGKVAKWFKGIIESVSEKRKI
jgi:glycosyltransferase involved in cell wall biosynthesis